MHNACIDNRTPRRARVVAILAPLLLIAGLSQPALAAAGDLDNTFSGDGMLTTPVGSNAIGHSGEARDVAVQADGKIVAVGQVGAGSVEHFALVRYKTNGLLDPSFDGDGKVTTPFGAPFGSLAGANAVAIQPDGKIVAAGWKLANDSRFAVARYMPNGALDTSFSGDGKVVTTMGSYDTAYSVAIQADGRIVVAGAAEVGLTRFALARYDTFGVLDPTFGSGGKVITQIGADGGAASVGIQSDGKIVAAGRARFGTKSRFALARYDTLGVLDPTFSGDGRVNTVIGIGGAEARSVAIQTGGEIVAAGFSGNGSGSRFALARYDTFGILDPSFSGNGKVTNWLGTQSNANSVAIQTDGKIVVAGSAFQGSHGLFVVARYDLVGVLDPTFSGDGKVQTQVGNGGYAASIAIQPANGRLVLAGQATPATYFRFALARYEV